MRILIVVPDLKKPGGVAALFNTLKIEKFCSGISLFSLSNSMPRIIRIPYKFLEFIWKLKKNDIVHINPSLNKKSFYRDGFFSILARILKKKLIVYWHGWECQFEQNIHSKKLQKIYFKYTFLKADMHIVLGSIFKQSLIQLGIEEKKIVIESNAADDSYLNLKKSFIQSNRGNRFFLKLLFISRIEESKGVFIAIDALKILNKKGNFHLSIAGEGPALAAAKKKTEVEHIENVTFLGVVKEEKKHQLFVKSDILLFPTYYPEGMPICIIEAMLYGLIVISRPVGGIPDWVKESKNGYLIGTKHAEDFANKIIELNDDKEKLDEMSRRNSMLANEYFTPDALNKRLLNYYQKLMELPA